MPKLILDQVNIVCGDVEASVVFYCRLGVCLVGYAVLRGALSEAVS